MQINTTAPAAHNWQNLGARENICIQQMLYLHDKAVCDVRFVS
jgi:hypothetical protein